MAKENSKFGDFIAFRISPEEKRMFEKCLFLENRSKAEFLRQQVQQLISGPMGLFELIDDTPLKNKEV